MESLAGPLTLQPRLSLALLTALNFFNYIDRSVLFAVQPLAKQEFHSTDANLGFLTTAFFFGYMFTAPFFGLLADRYSRKTLIILGATIWSGATLLTAITHDFQTLLFRHTVVGIGEASFATIASSRTSSKNATVGASSPFSLWPTRRAQPWVMCSGGSLANAMAGVAPFTFFLCGLSGFVDT